MFTVTVAGRRSKSTDLHEDFFLEQSWVECTSLNTTNLSKRQLAQQEAIWELVTTELQYLKTMRLVINLFYGGLTFRLSSEGFKRIDLDRLFGNIRDVYQANLMFWENYITPLLNKCRDQHVMLTVHESVAEAFNNVENLFEPYIGFCVQQAACRSYAQQLTINNEHFCAFLSWAESRKECQRQKLVDLLIVPMQRLTKYTLLLNSVLRQTTDENEIVGLNEMITKVEAFVSKVNKAVRSRNESLKLLAISCRIEGCDYLESHNEECNKILESFNKISILVESPTSDRRVLYEDELRLREGQSKVDAYCILLTDMLLIARTTKRQEQNEETLTYTDEGIGSTDNGLRLIKPPIRLDKVELRELRDGQSALLIIFTDFQPIIECSFILSCDNIATWIAKIRLAQSAILRSQKQSSYRQRFSLDPRERRHLSSDRSKLITTAPSSPDMTGQMRSMHYHSRSNLALSGAGMSNSRRRSDGDLSIIAMEPEVLQREANSKLSLVSNTKVRNTLHFTLSLNNEVDSEPVVAEKNEDSRRQDSVDDNGKIGKFSATLPQINIMSDTPTSSPKADFLYYDFSSVSEEQPSAEKDNTQSTSANKAQRNQLVRNTSETSKKSMCSCWRRRSWNKKKKDTIQCLISQVHSHSFYRISDTVSDKAVQNS